MSNISKKQDFSTLSLKDLLEARDAYHVHLMNLEHVVGTAVGKYLIRKGDPDYDRPFYTKLPSKGKRRTLFNSALRPWSNPCVLVFINKWTTLKEWREKPANYVPPYLYLPDGRVIPTCVVYTEEKKRPSQPRYKLNFPNGLLGGGFPVLSTVQGEVRIGSIGCLVTDGHSIYALTNRHVAGIARQPSSVVINGNQRVIGEASGAEVRTAPFSEIYPGWPGSKMIINLDAGLIRVKNSNLWTAQVYGIGEMGELADANVDTLHIDYIGQKVKANASVSGEQAGTIKALFYQYQTAGGYEYVTDFLIGPYNFEEEEEYWLEKMQQGERKRAAKNKKSKATAATETKPKSLTTLPGDSGTLWFLAEKDRFDRHRPLAMQWGGHSLAESDNDESHEFVLATSLSSICHVLKVQILRDWNLGYNEYWGKLAHYKIGALACELTANKKLKKLLTANKDRIGLSDSNLKAKNFPASNQTGFVALADVPDLVWRSKRGKDKAAHFAAIDKKGAGKFKNKTLLELWNEKKANRNVKTWKEFYEELGIKKQAKCGALPFRIRQCYEEMVDAVKKHDVTRYIAAAGILAHYVGDCCIPLHVSYLHHGEPGKEDEEDVHEVYETRMIDRFRVELISDLNTKLKGHKYKHYYTRGGEQATEAAMKLMAYTLKNLPPKKIITAFKKYPGGKQRTEYMWKKLRKDTVECMKKGAICLVEMWQSAWREGKGTKVPKNKLKAVKESDLKKLYNKKTFIESKWLKDMSFG